MNYFNDAKLIDGSKVHCYFDNDNHNGYITIKECSFNNLSMRDWWKLRSLFSDMNILRTYFYDTFKCECDFDFELVDSRYLIKISLSPKTLTIIAKNSKTLDHEQVAICSLEDVYTIKKLLDTDLIKTKIKGDD